MSYDNNNNDDDDDDDTIGVCARAARSMEGSVLRAQLIERGLLVPASQVVQRDDGAPCLRIGDLPPERYLPRRERYPDRESISWPRKNDRN